MRKFFESFGSLTVGFLYQDEEKEATVDDIPKGEKQEFLGGGGGGEIKTLVESSRRSAFVFSSASPPSPVFAPVHQKEKILQYV